MRHLWVFLVVILSFSSCEDVVDVEVPTTEPVLVVDAIFRVDFSKEFVPVSVKISESSDFFEENIPAQLDDNALIYYGRPNPDSPNLFDSISTSSLAETFSGSGIYEPDPTFDRDQRIATSLVFPNTVFYLSMTHRGRSYIAETPFSTVVPMDRVEQGNETLFDDDDVEIKVSFTDEPNNQNRYVFDFGEGEFFTTDDQFFDGQEFEFSYFPTRDIDQGDTVVVSIMGADQQFYNYIDLLVEQTEDNGGVFETPIATVRGNVFDVTGLDNINIFDNVERPNDYAFGYFAVVEEFKDSLVVE